MIEAAQVNDEYERVPFEEDGRVSMHTSKLLWECNARCGCGVDCISKASQRGRKFGLKIKRFPGKGWGVVLNQTEPIPPRAFVARYVGEIITNKEALRRGQEYDKKGATWLFDLDYNTENTAEYSIDAYHMGNESHFFNHSCDPNLSVYMLAGNTGGDSSITTHSFWSNRWIYEGDELTFDYNGAANNEGLQQRQQNQQQQKKKKKRQKGQTRCLCGSANCREWVHLFRGK
ncbi:hypothetical protein BC939DRAFT_74741 [Gamsiella multidivaricata]|uniref:uncharacterized protein n=1 Tax=Gamsiella multidivaricata TaxID=101098 RepID=UPI00221FDBDB|nr:uncharacterized protein BC939DRAFT_74741 [Gamsiella multidivaricata]KAI7815903.1 hypothetical protein BC939DRAFT_74741 [Gamsiella multidivaricata]